MVKVNLLILGLKGCMLQMNGEALCDSGLDKYGVFLSTEFSVIINKLEENARMFGNPMPLHAELIRLRK